MVFLCLLEGKAILAIGLLGIAKAKPLQRPKLKEKGKQMDKHEAFGIVLSLAEENALDSELHCDMQEEVDRQEEAFKIVRAFLDFHNIITD